MAENPNVHPPHSVEAEEAVLGSVLINGEAMKMVSGFLTPADFYLVKHGWIFEAMLSLSARGDDIDNLTVVHELSITGRLDDIGGSATITRLVNSTPTHWHIETYARILEHAAVRRKGLVALGKMAQSLLEENSPLPDVLGTCHDLFTEATKLKQDGDFRFFSEFASENYDRIEQRYNNRGTPLGIPTGLAVLDAELEAKGWQNGELILIAARPGMGKSALAMGCAVHAAKLGQHVAVISKEMTGNELHFRVLAAESGLNGAKFKTGNIDSGEFDRIAEATLRTSEMSLAIDDSGATAIDQLDDKVKRLHREWGIDILFVDFVQLLHSDDKKAQNRNLEIDVIGRKFKEISMTFNIPVVALSQLSRKVEDRADKRPIMSDLRDSGTLEQVADTIIFIYRDDYYDEHSQTPDIAELHIAKQRNGVAGGRPKVGWIGNTTRFVDDIKHISLEGF